MRIDDLIAEVRAHGGIIRRDGEMIALSAPRPLRAFLPGGLSSIAVHDRLQAELRERLRSRELEGLMAEGAGFSDDEAVAALSGITSPIVTTRLSSG